MRRGLALFALLCALGPGVAELHAAPAPSSAARDATAAAIDAIADDIAELRLERAERALAALAADHPGMPDVLFEQARLAFYRGQYAEAVALADRAIASARGRDKRAFAAMRELMSNTLAVTRDCWVVLHGGS